HPVLILQDAARPHSRRHRVAAVDADLSAFEALGCADSRLGVHQDGAVVERPHQEDRHGGHRLSVRLGGNVGGDCHLADVELVAAHHAAERGDERIDLYEIEREGSRLGAAVLERPVVALGAGDGFELQLGHGLEWVSPVFCYRPYTSWPAGHDDSTVNTFPRY